MTSPKVGMRSDIGGAVFPGFSDRRASRGRHAVADNAKLADYLNGIPSALCCRADGEDVDRARAKCIVRMHDDCGRERAALCCRMRRLRPLVAR
ncbi:hypothetical protein Bcep18194_C7447 [Burkholderia lata]|uniref:Uncharacterized protein n=1 Tax=Burkholderia lata (strain ATCC 17760 / DSM 23089 / LMG 22485 / NCIMB 9086 / R18194 / 383) TaxID=482957 RepID=Q39M25_BURL3|nr:hypothetical protein Bcep18194_C7447 [Burkholderia lata]